MADDCDDRTRDVVRSLQDNRVYYIPLPARFGEQAGPNSVGVALATTPFIAFLNHDDVYLEDHLAVALEDLIRTRSDMYRGRAAFAGHAEAISDGTIMPRFWRTHGNDRSIEQCFLGQHDMFEPASAWVIRRSFADKVGHWRPSLELYRSSLQDWVIRAWRADVKLRFGEKLSVLKVTTHYGHGEGTPAYQFDSPEHEALDAWLAAHSSAEVRRRVATDVASYGGVKPAKIPTWIPPPDSMTLELWRRFNELAGTTPKQRAAAARRYKETGADCYDEAAIEIGIEPGGPVKRFKRIKTGSELPTPPSVDEVLAAIRAKGVYQ